MSSPDIPSGPDAPVSGEPGQPGNAAAGGLVQGQVVDAAGNAIAQVVVTPQSTDTPPQPVPEIAVLTDDTGQYQWTLPPGSYTLTFIAEGYAPLSKPVTVLPDRPTELDAVLQKQ